MPRQTVGKHSHRDKNGRASSETRQRVVRKFLPGLTHYNPSAWSHRAISEEIPNSLVENRNPLPRQETELRKNEMKLRKNEIISPKSFSVPHWKIKDHHGGIHDFFRRDCFIFIMRQPWTFRSEALVSQERDKKETVAKVNSLTILLARLS